MNNQESESESPVDPGTYGVCCNCGYDGEEETICERRLDETHCVHWWDGPPAEST